MPRHAEVRRKTAETSVEVTLDLDEPSDPVISTGIGFLDHMVAQLARHGGFTVELRATGDLDVDAHHTVEDTGLALGDAFRRALGDKSGIARFGSALVPLDEALAEVAVDLSGRPFLRYQVPAARQTVTSSGFDLGLLEDFLQAFVASASITLHVQLREARDSHHGAEAIFKAVGRALGDAVKPDSRYGNAAPTTKGLL